MLAAHQVRDAYEVAGPAPFRPSTMTEVADAELAGTVGADAGCTCCLSRRGLAPVVATWCVCGLVPSSVVGAALNALGSFARAGRRSR